MNEDYNKNNSDKSVQRAYDSTGNVRLNEVSVREISVRLLSMPVGVDMHKYNESTFIVADDFSRESIYCDSPDLRKPTPTFRTLENKDYDIMKTEIPKRMTQDKFHGTGLEGLVKEDNKN